MPYCRFLSVTSHINCCTLPDKRCLYQCMCLYQVMITLHFLNDVANDAASTQKLIITSYSLVRRVNQLGKLINRIPDLRLFISSLPGSPGKLDIKRFSPSILYVHTTDVFLKVDFVLELIV